ncbi:MAG: glycosyltransferase [Tepidisphaeraceae bacterium]
MKVLLTTISLDPERGGGTAERTRCIAHHLHAQKIDCHVLTMEGGRYAEALWAQSIPVTVTGHLRVRYHIPLLNFRTLRRLIGWADIVHVLGYWNVLSAATCHIARASGKPFVLSAAGEFAGLEHPRWDQRIFHATLGHGMIRDASLLIAITSLEREQIIRQLNVNPNKVVVVPNGVDPIDLQIDGDEFLPSGRFILFLGRLAHIKGPDILLDAFASISQQFPDISLVIAGPDFGMRPELAARVSDRGLAGRVVFTGFLDDRARWTAYRKAALLAVPSRSEAMSLVALEAAAAGTPVLISDQCGFADIASSAGAVVAPPDVEGLSRGLAIMLAQETDLRAMGEKARAFVLERYAWPNIATQLAGQFERVCGDHTRTPR